MVVEIEKMPKIIQYLFILENVFGFTNIGKIQKNTKKIRRSGAITSGNRFKLFKLSKNVPFAAIINPNTKKEDIILSSYGDLFV
jgi:hypothetical protein